MNATITELIPSSSRKSFYGKAKVLHAEDETDYLRSYETIVASVKDGEVRRHWDGQSATTSAHIRSFLCQFAPRFDSSKFKNLETVSYPTLTVKI